MNPHTDIKGYEGFYKINSEGEVISVKRSGAVMKPRLHKGYLQLNLSKGGKSRTCVIHRLVAQTFIPNPENKQQVNHIDGDKMNNNVENLEWVTAHENMSHAHYVLGKELPVGGNVGQKRKGVKVNGEEYASLAEASRALGRNDGFIGRVIYKRRTRPDSYQGLIIELL